MPKQVHIHKYRRMVLGTKRSYVIFRCVLPKCTHYVPEKLALGREALCWGCAKQIVINLKSVRQSKPRCANCTSDGIMKKDQKAHGAAVHIVEQDVLVPDVTEIVEKDIEELEDETIERLVNRAIIGKGLI